MKNDRRARTGLANWRRYSKKRLFWINRCDNEFTLGRPLFTTRRCSGEPGNNTTRIIITRMTRGEFELFCRALIRFSRGELRLSERWPREGLMTWTWSSPMRTLSDRTERFATISQIPVLTGWLYAQICSSLVASFCHHS